MKSLKNLDLYKGVILLCLIALPGVWLWIRSTQQSIERAEQAILDATRPGGYLEEIGMLQKQLRTVKDNSDSANNQTGDAPSYFDGQIKQSAAAGQLGPNQFTISQPREEPATTGQKQLVKDFIVKIDWMPLGGKEFVFTRAFLFAVLFNCESSARSKQSAPLPSIWKLHTIKLVNSTASKLASQQLTPPAELQDEWIVTNMQFARREPRKEAKK
jgi:hypothetical protein